MKNIIIAAVILLTLSTIACGGQVRHSPLDGIPEPYPTTTPVPMPTLTANMIFQNTSQFWQFVTHCQNRNINGTLGPVITAHMYITVIPIDATHSNWHYTKDQPCAYWMPNSVFYEDSTKPLTQLDFFLEQDSTGAWYSIGGHIIAPNGFPWDLTVPRPPQDVTFGVTSNPGVPRPYLIIPAVSNGITITMITNFPDTQGPNTLWETDSITVLANTPVYQGYAMQSHQKEGNCTPLCADEAWLFGENEKGMVQVTVFDTGSGALAIPIVLTRIY